MSFLDRFQHKIATVTAHGHLKKADGSEEIRVGPPKRKPKTDNSSARADMRPAYAASSKPGVSKQAVPPLAVPTSNTSRTQQVQQSGSRQQPTYDSPTNSPRHKTTGRDAYGSYDNNHSHRDAYTLDAHSIPGRLKDDDEYDDEYVNEPQQQSTGRSYASSKSPSPTHLRSQPAASKPSPRSTTHSSTSPSKDVRSPHEINEARVHTDADQLAFSRKARSVQYAPCKLAQYKKEKPSEYYELGKLQPDLNADDLVAKRANAERIKAFSKSLRAINKATQPLPKKRETEATTSDVSSTSTRSKALAFAKRIPKPKPAIRATTDDGSTSTTSSVASQSIAATSRPINCVLDDDSDDDDVSSELQQLQLRHQASRAQVDALIKKG